MGKWADIKKGAPAEQPAPGKWSRMKLEREISETQEKIKDAEMEHASMTWGQAFRQSLSNLPSSAIETAKALAAPIAHPIKTGRAVGHLFAGAVQKLTPNVQEDEPYVDAFVDFMKERYGSIDNFKQTVAKDPVGVTADIASIFMAGGGAIRVAGTGSKLSTIGKAVEMVGAGMEPVNAVRQVAVLPLRIIPRAVPNKLWQSGVKLSTTLTKEQRAAITVTALENEITPTVRGLYKLRDKIDDFNATIANKIDQAQTTGATIEIDRLFDDFSELEMRYSLSGDINKIKAIEEGIRKSNAKMGRTSLTVKEAQRLKQDIYKKLTSYYGSVKYAPASVKALQAVAKQAKLAIEEIIPEIKQLNAQEGALIELYDAIERPVNRIANRDLIGIGTPMKTATGGIIGDLPGAATGLALGILDTPAVKSKVAIVMDRLRRKGIKVKETPALLRLMSIEAGKIPE